MIIKAVTWTERGSLAHYATICREWQGVIEETTFGRLTLTPSRLDSFQKVPQRQMALVKYIWLNIELHAYDCSQCENGETDPWWEGNAEIIRKAIRDLFRSLSTWGHGESLVLDISAHSPSDLKHYSKHLHFGSDAVPEVGLRLGMAQTHDPRHGWFNGQRQDYPPIGAIDRLFEDIQMEEDFWNGLPEVGAVTCLLLRRQTRRRWEPTSLGKMLRLLPRLQEVYYEPWREWDRVDQVLTDKYTPQLFKSLGFRRLRKLVLFENSDDEFVTAIQGVHRDYDAEPVRVADITVSKALAEASLGFEQLSASFIADARWFFEARQPCWAWNQLTSLVLTSRLLNPYQSHAVVNDLLQAAAAAAMAMPMLTTMELWNGGKGIA
ncbi:MAG: hypothetical protein Q9207_008540, partial [Kuettlingeria erythrocarpa]